MKKLLLLLAPLALLATACAEKVDLGAGQAVLLTVPDTWKAAELPALPPGMAAGGIPHRYVTKNGSNDSVLLSLVPVPDDRLTDSATLKAMIEEASQQFVAGSVEGKVALKELKIGAVAGFSVTFTDVNLVGKPTVKDDYKAMTACFVYLGDRVLVSATIFTDDVNGKAYAEALRLLKSITLQRPGSSI